MCLTVAAPPTPSQAALVPKTIKYKEAPVVGPDIFDPNMCPEMVMAIKVSMESDGEIHLFKGRAPEGAGD